MNTLYWILVFGFLMSCISLVGSITLVLKPSTLDRILLPLVAFAAGSLIGAAFFHMIPAAVEQMGNHVTVYVWLAAGFVLFLALEQFLNWHHSHSRHESEKQPLTYLVLLADGLHNFIGGLYVAASFLVDIRLGVIAWLAAARAWRLCHSGARRMVEVGCSVLQFSDRAHVCGWWNRHVCCLGAD